MAEAPLILPNTPNTPGTKFRAAVAIDSLRWLNNKDNRETIGLKLVTDAHCLMWMARRRPQMQPNSEF